MNLILLYEKLLKNIDLLYTIIIHENGIVNSVHYFSINFNYTYKFIKKFIHIIYIYFINLKFK